MVNKRQRIWEGESTIQGQEQSSSDDQISQNITC